MTHCIKVPELILNKKEINNLKKLYFLNKLQYGRTYVSDNGVPSELTIVADYPKSDLIKKIENKIENKYIDASYFVSNRGIEPHTDDNRQCIFSFEISNDENIPINFHVDNLVTAEHYNGEVLMWNPQIRHSADKSITERIFFQIELQRNLTYNDYLRLYQSDKLIVQ